MRVQNWLNKSGLVWERDVVCDLGTYFHIFQTFFKSFQARFPSLFIYSLELDLSASFSNHKQGIFVIRYLKSHIHLEIIFKGVELFNIRRRAREALRCLYQSPKWWGIIGESSWHWATWIWTSVFRRRVSTTLRYDRWFDGKGRWICQSGNRYIQHVRLPIKRRTSWSHQ